MQLETQLSKTGHRRPSPRLGPDQGNSFAKALFFGRVLSGNLFPYPAPDKNERAVLEILSAAIQRMSTDLEISRIEKEKCIPEEFLDRFRELGLFGLTIPEVYGGLGLSTAGYVQILSETSLLDGSICTTVGAHQSLGLKGLLLFGTEEQKSRYLPDLATGKKIAGFGLTEPEAGSDINAIKTTAVLSSDGRHYLLNGTKIWITNGGIADFFTVFAKTEIGGKNRVTAFLVTRDMPGFSSGPEEKKLGMRGSSTTSLTFENVRVPIENRLGEVGDGFKIAVRVLNTGRLGLSAACALAPRRLIEMARNHVNHRKQFGKNLSEFGLIQSKVANLTIDSYVAESLVCMTTSLVDREGFDCGIESAICKVFTTEIEWRAVNECLQMAGGTGYMEEYGYEKILRDSRIFTIWEGANDVLRLFIGLSGLQGPAEQLKEVARALSQPMQDMIGSLGILTDYGARWLQRRVGPSENLAGVHPAMSREARVFENYTGRLAQASEMILRLYGKRILENQFAIRRLADIAIDLYALACALSRVSRTLEQKPNQAEHETHLVRAFCRKARRRMAENLRRLDRNDDELEKSIARAVLEEGLPQHALFL